MNAIEKALANADNGEYEDDFVDPEEAGEVAASKAIKSGRSILAAAAEQVQAEARVAWESNLNEVGEAAAIEVDGIGNRASDALAVMNNALDDDGSSDEETFGGNAEANIALRVACYRGEVRTVEKLLSSSGGAHAKAKDRHGWTALHWACKSGDCSCIDLLVEAVKADGKVASYLNCADALSGWTSLHVACMNGKKDAVKALIHHGANCDKRSLFNETPAECIPATSRNAKQLMRLLGVIEDKDNRDEGKQQESKDAGEEKR